MLAVLQRSDASLFKFVAVDEAFQEATRLGEGQCFNIEIFAHFNVSIEHIIEPLHTHHIQNGWYEVELLQVLNAWLDAKETDKYGAPMEESEESEESLPEPIHKTPPKSRKPPVQKKTSVPKETDESQITKLPDWLAYCNANEAPLAT